MPHLLIAGATGSGKSVGLNTMILSLLFRLRPWELKLVIIDPKKVELTPYAMLEHHFLALSPEVGEPIVTSPEAAVIVLKAVVLEMERRYDILAQAGQRNIVEYNRRVRDGKLESHFQPMPYIVLVIDELADLMLTAARMVEEPITRLAQLARAVGIHLLVATQRPSVDVLTGLIKANFPARIAYQVASRVDSRVILDMPGAEQLLGNGDMLFLPGGVPKPIRLQNAYVSLEEVEAVCSFIAQQPGVGEPYWLPSVSEREGGQRAAGAGGRDPLFAEAARLVVRHQQGSVSLLQRRLKIGYSRAARIMDELEAAGIVGPADGSRARQVLVRSEAELEGFL
jgi:S-DNA-T family DNA segregation ATPase FtsK/SpoIIIE